MSSLASLVTIFGLPILLFQLWLERRDRKADDLRERAQLLECLEVTLGQIAVWARASEGGYPDTPEMRERLIENRDLMNPFHHIFHLFNPLGSVFVLPGIVHFGSDFQMALVGLNQAIVSFHSYLDRIYSFAMSDPDRAIELHLKLNGARALQLTAPEELFGNKIKEMFVILHLGSIGDINSRGLYYWHHQLGMLVTQEKDRLNDDNYSHRHPWLRAVKCFPCICEFFKGL